MRPDTVRVSTATGIVEGIVCGDIHRWRSIPYAKPPVGTLRFRAPQPANPWPGVLDCRNFAYCAPQKRGYTMVGIGKYQPTSEDCLTLNVVTPRARDRDALPVMVFIHGGGYVAGTSATPLYDGASFARRGCVYVSVNYRLGLLGTIDLSTLSTAKNPIDSNLYLRDLVLALRWVRANIGQFGGDPDKVTVFGESAGAHAVAALLAVPSAEGLFAQAISESPVSGVVHSRELTSEIARRFAAWLDVGASDAADALMHMSAATLVTTQDEFLDHLNRTMPGTFPAGPVPGDDCLPSDPIDSMRRGSAHRIPLIVGTNADEARLLTRFVGPMAKEGKLISSFMPITKAAIETAIAVVDPIAQERITAAYPGYPNRTACISLGGDLAVGSSAWDIAEAHCRHAPTYVYRYDFAPRMLRWLGVGATHITELLAVFDAYRTKSGLVLCAASADRSSARRVSDEVQEHWRAFGRSGAPGDRWPAYTTTERCVMVFDRTSRVEHDPNPQRRMAWKGFSRAR